MQNAVKSLNKKRIKYSIESKNNLMPHLKKKILKLTAHIPELLYHYYIKKLK